MLGGCVLTSTSTSHSKHKQLALNSFYPIRCPCSLVSVMWQYKVHEKVDPGANRLYRYYTGLVLSRLT